jgi:hypothetical protein
MSDRERLVGSVGADEQRALLDQAEVGCRSVGLGGGIGSAIVVVVTAGRQRQGADDKRQGGQHRPQARSIHRVPHRCLWIGRLTISGPQIAWSLSGDAPLHFLKQVEANRRCPTTNS